ncbi:MAG: YjgN family protein [Lysobacterales bacterium]
MTENTLATPVATKLTEVRETPLPIAFTGNTAVYFRIWIVNLCLTLITLGVFSAWAKVRKKRYFYASTRIDDTPMQYLAEPLPILKGRIVATVLFGIWWFSSSFYFPALPWVVGIGLIVAPWIVTSSASFNSRYSAWRNLTLVFHGNYLGAALTLYWLGLIPLLMYSLTADPADLNEADLSLLSPLVLQLVVLLGFGILFPFWLNRLKRFITSHTAYGGHRVRYGATGGQFFNVYFAAGFIVIGGAIVSGSLFALKPSLQYSNIGMIALSLPFYLSYVFAFAYVRARVTNLVWNQARLGPVTFRSSMVGTELFALYFTNALGIIASLGLATPWAVMRTMRYRLEHLEASSEAPMDTFVGDERSSVHAAAAETGDFFDLDLSL